MPVAVSPKGLTVKGEAQEIMRRHFAAFLAGLFAFFAVTAPARAFAPVAVLAAPVIEGASGTAYLAGGLAGIVGMAGLWMELGDLDGNKTRIPLSSKPEANPPAPAAPPTADPANSWCVTIAGDPLGPPSHCGYETEQAALAFWLSTACADSGGVGSYSGGTTAYCAWGGMNSTQTAQNVACPSGYSYQNSTCTLVNPRQAKPDKNCDVQIVDSGGGPKYVFQQDVDCPSGNNIGGIYGPKLRGDGNSLYIDGVNASGRPMVGKITLNGDGQGKTKIEVWDTVAPGVIEKTSATIDHASGNVTSATKGTEVGYIETPAADTVPVSTPGTPSPTDTPQLKTDPAKPIPVETCGLPGKPACIIDDTGFAGKEAFMTPKSAEVTTELDKLRDAVVKSPESLPNVNLSWIPSLLPGASVACAPIVLGMSVNHGPLNGVSGSSSLDLCPHFGIVRQIMGYFFGLMAVFGVFRAFARANGGTA